MGKRTPVAERRKQILDLMDSEIAAQEAVGDKKEAALGRALRAGAEEIFDFFDNLRRIADAAEAKKNGE